MVKVIISKDNDFIKYISMTGHTEYDDYGKDIVCASCSSIVITTINAIIKFNKDYIKYIQNKDEFNIEILEVNEIVINLINNMLNLLQELADEYPNTIEIKEEN